MPLSDKKILITGAAGFIGFEILKLLYKLNAKITALVHKNIPDEFYEFKNINVIQADIADISNNISEFNGFDIIIHTAGIVSDCGFDEDFRKVNYLPLEFLTKIPCKKFIYISSTDVYGIKNFFNAKENTPYHEFPKNPYPKYKILCEKLIKSKCKNYVILRPAAVFGNPKSVLEKRFISFLKYSPFVVHFGCHRGKNRWPLCDVKNVAKAAAYCAIFNDFNNDAVNIINKKRISIDDYYKMLIQLHFPEKKFKTIYLPMIFGKVLGRINDFLNMLLSYKNPLDPTYYAIHHISSNLDFNSDKMLFAIEKFDNFLQIGRV